LLVVRPPHDRILWAVEQLLRCGCFPLVVISGALRLGRAGHRWVHAAEAGGTTGLVISAHPSRSVPATVRLAVGGGGLVVTRNRGGGTGRSGPLPLPTERANPWR
jgi:hypothetical protein